MRLSLVGFEGAGTDDDQKADASPEKADPGEQQPDPPRDHGVSSDFGADLAVFSVLVGRTG